LSRNLFQLLGNPGPALARAVELGMAYYYATVPGVFPVPDPEKGPTIVYSARLLMEHALFDMKVQAQRLDVAFDGTRAFRTDELYMARFQKDQLGYVIAFGDKKVYWTTTNPVGADAETEAKWRAL